MINIHSRRSFIERCALAGAAGGLATLLNVPPFVRKALAEGQIGTNGKKLIFIWLRFGSDSMNLAIPTLDPSYSQQRPAVYQARTGQTSPTDFVGGVGDYNTPGAYGTNGGLNKMFDPTLYTDFASTPRAAATATYAYDANIPSGNGFLALHSRAKFLAPVFNDGDLAIVHRTGYPYLSRSHFDSQRYWENGKPPTPVDSSGNFLKEGIFYRTMAEAITADPSGVGTRALTGVSLQNALPLLLRGSKYAMTNISDPLRYSLLGVPNNADTRKSLTNALAAGKDVSFPNKGSNRDILDLNFANLSNTLKTFAEINFAEVFTDTLDTDGDTTAGPYNLFPNNNATNGGYAAHGNNAAKYVIPTTYNFTTQVKNAALTTLLTEATIVGVELGGWDHHNNQVTGANRTTGVHSDKTREFTWALYALKRFFQKYGVGGTSPKAGATVGWNDVVVVAFSEFGRTSAGNNNNGTDHAEGGAIYVAGGSVNGGVYCAHPTVDTPGGSNAPALVSRWTNGTGGQNGTSGQNGTMFQASARYLKRCVDYRSVFGEIIRDHLGATPAQLGRILPGYADEATFKLKDGGTQADGVGVTGELGLV
jgi:uncharacterized protein (DUF1501 family)